MTIRGMEPGRKPALLISECQNGIVNPDYAHDAPLVREVARRGIIPGIALLAQAFREHGLPVVYCNIAAPPGFHGFKVNCLLANQLRKEGELISGTRFAAVHDALPVMAGDVICERMHGMAPFTGTELDAILRGHDVDTVVLSGVSTNIALPGAATEAIGLGYNVVLVEDCTSGGTPETHEMQVRMHLPFLASITDREAVTAALREGAPHRR